MSSKCEIHEKERLSIKLEREKTKAGIASMVADAMRKEQEHTRVKLSSQVSNDVATNVPSQMEDDEQARNADFHLWLALMYKFEKLASHVDPCGVNAFCRHDHKDHYDDDACLEGESSTQEQQEFDSWGEDQGTNDDEVLSEEVSPKLLAEIYIESQIVWESKKEDLTLQILEKPTPVYEGYKRDLNAPQIYLFNKDLFYLKTGNSKIRKYELSLHKIHAFPFLKDELEEINTRWLKKRVDPDEVYPEQKIIDVIRILSDQGHGQEFMKEIVVKRADVKFSTFLESDIKYLHKNDNEDTYLMCIYGKIKYQETGILKSLNVFIRSSISCERVHDYQLRLESYQLKVNLIAPKLIFPGIEEKKPYTITSLPFVGLIY
ncbi:hypothetical protein Tco_0864642 [Tanacetum coccineum]